jgi:hypothetical protein
MIGFLSHLDIMDSYLIRIASRVSAEATEVVSDTRHKDRGKKFVLSEFKSLDDPDEFLDYATDRLHHLGSGSSRSVFSLSSSKVLKIARERQSDYGAGMGQNKAEVDVYNGLKTKSVCAKVFDSDSEYRWIISENVRPLESNEEFFSLNGIELPDVFFIARHLEYENTVDDTYEALEEWYGSSSSSLLKMPSREKFDEWAQIVGDLLDQGVIGGDLELPGHWGITPSRNTVILDYGFTSGVYEEFYAEHGTGT